MKKVLSTLLLASATMIFGQVVVNENFNSLTVGNLGTDITGATAGQNGWFTQATSTAPNAANSNFQITSVTPAYGNSLQMIGSNSNDGSKWVFKNDFPAAWTNRTSGNNILQIEFDFYTGAATTSANQSRFYVSNVTGTGPTAVVKNLVAFTYKHSTRQPGILAYLDPCVVLGATYCGGTYPAGNYNLTYNATPPATGSITLNNNEWVKVGIAYNYTNGEVDIKIVRASDGTVILESSFTGAAPTSNPTEYAMSMVPRTLAAETNTLAATATFDNVKISMVSTLNLLSTDDVKVEKNRDLTIYPNPVSDILNIKTKEKVQSASVFDMTGRKIEARVMDNKVDVTNLERGTYIINIQTEKGTTSEKFIKK